MSNPFANTEHVAYWLATLGMGVVIVVGMICVLVWAFIIQPRRERRRISRGRK